MRRSAGFTLLALLAALALPKHAAAQEGSRHFVCAYLWDHASRTFWVGRQIIEVRSTHPSNSGLLDRSVPTQFSARVHGQISRDDLLAHHPGGYASWGLAQSVIRESLAEAKQDCLGKIADARREDFVAYGVGSPIYEPSSDDERTQSHAFLSILEFPNYEAGTIAERARRGERGKVASTPKRDADGWLPGERAEYDRKMRAKAISILAEADSLYDLTRYADAREKYRQIMNIGVDAYVEFQPYAQERIAQCDRLMGMQAYSTFNKSTGLSFGAYGSQSYFDRDATLIGVSVAKRVVGLNAIFGVATGAEGFKVVLGDGSDDGSFGEFTRYQLMAGGAVPKLRAGPFGLHAGYVFQQTDRRALHLGMAGVHYGKFGTGPTVRIDVTQVFGTPRIGFGVDLNFSDL